MMISELPSCNSEEILSRIKAARRLWLFLDYDGTLADFAPTPEHVEPDPELLGLLDKLNHRTDIRITVVSGRRLSHVKNLLPLDNVMLAGTYGIEMQTASGEQVLRLDFESVRPTLESIKPLWIRLLSGRQGFFLEDKGWSLAIHAKDAHQQEAVEVINQAREQAKDWVDTGTFRLLGGHKFLEIGPKIANKGKAVEYILESYPWPEAVYIYIGDDDKDEEAFGIIQEQGGIAIVVGPETRHSQANCRMESPQEVRRWLRSLEGTI